MSPDQLRAARTLLLALHEQADKTARLHGRRDAYRTALACIEIVQAAMAPAPVVHAAPMRRAQAKRFAPTQELSLPHFEPTALAAAGFAPTLAATQLVPLL